MLEVEQVSAPVSTVRIEKMKPSVFKQFKADNKSKFHFIFSKGMERWLITDRNKVYTTGNGLHLRIGQYFPLMQEFHWEETDPSRYRDTGKHTSVY